MQLEATALDTAPTSAACRVCESSRVVPFFRIEGVPVQDGLLWPTRGQALASPVADIDLLFCDDCGHIYNRLFDIAKLRFDAAYDISLHHSRLYRGFVDSVVARLVDTYGLRGKTILAVGCGKADFLRALCRAGGSRGVGFDPTFVETDAGRGGGELVTVLREFYSEQHSDVRADAVVCRSVLQYFADPRKFLGLLATALGGSGGGGVVYVEVPNAVPSFRRLEVWNLAYEHGSFYSAASLVRLFERSGFEVRMVRPCFDDQMLEIDATPARMGTGGAAKHPAGVVGASALRDDVLAFADCYHMLRASWRDRLEAFRRAGRRVVLWGAGARAIGFLTSLGVEDDALPFVVDINPKRHGRFLPRTGQLVVAPESLREYRPDVIIATNPTFASEIRDQVAALGLACDFLTL